jgi:hypothetical protein
LSSKWLYIALATICLIGVNCEHEEAPPKFYDRYVITLNNGHFQKVVHFQNDTLHFFATYNYLPESVEVLKRDKYQIITDRRYYYLNKLTGLADSCLDSFWYLRNALFISKIIYSYDKDSHVLNSRTLTYSNSSNVSISDPDFTTTFTLKDGNTMRKDNTFCNSYYSYQALSNKLDIFNFVGTYNGKGNLQLLKTYDSGCHAGPSYSPERSDYSYTLNSDGYVIERIENRSLGYYMHDQKQAQKEKHITTFTYIY